MQSAPRLKAGQELRGLSPETLTRVALHPLAHDNVSRVEALLNHLDACTSAGDLYEFQRQLFGAIYQVELRRAACSRALKRVKKGDTAQADAPELPAGSDATDVASWEFEIVVSERIARQLRTVGDGLAWKAFRHDRRFIMCLARNDRPGLLVNKEGLDYELGRVQDLWTREQHFGLLHDLTNCIRIADVTEVTDDNGALLHEVKKTKRTPAAQKARAQAAINAIMNDGVLPGAEGDARLVLLSTRFRADIAPLRDAIALARRRGMQGIGLSEGRVVFAASIWDMMRLSEGDAEHDIKALDDGKAAAIRRARIDSATYHLVGNSGDSAGRTAISAPLSIFPLDAADRADLICDVVTFETVVSVDALVSLLLDRGLAVDVLLPKQHQQVAVDSDVLQIRYRDRGLVVHAPAMNPLMFELLRPSTWCDAVAEALQRDAPPTHPELVLSEEANTWR